MKIETLYPLKNKNNKLLIYIIIGIIILIIVGIVLFLVFRNNKVEEQPTTEPQEEKEKITSLKLFYTCNMETFHKDGYTVDNIYEFTVDNDVVTNGIRKQTYKFETISDYTNLVLEENEHFKPSEKSEDINTLTKSYTFASYIPMETANATNIEEYINYLKTINYVCEIDET